MAHIALFETYQSQKDLESLAKSILEFMAERSLEALTHRWQKIKTIASIKLANFNPTAFGVLADFINDFKNVEFHYVDKQEMAHHCNPNAKACYLSVSSKGVNSQRLVLLEEDDYLLSRINSYVELWDYENTQQVVDQMVYSMSTKTMTHLIHELQHAYDDWRSGGKYVRVTGDYEANSQKYDELSNKLNKVTDSEYNQLRDAIAKKHGKPTPDTDKVERLKDEEAAFLARHHTQYLRQAHEVDARFTQTIHSTDFYEYDLDATLDQNKDVYRMKPYKEVLAQFKRKFHGYSLMTPKTQKRLLHHFGKFYLLETEFVEEMNRKSKTY
jgi:predicted  nucleic acid-binding Zn-ribbon protein